MFRSLRHACCLSALCLVAGPGARAAAPLAPTSPFLPPAASGAAAAENNPLELRGILADEGGYRFSIYDPVRHVGTWSRLNEPGHDFMVKAHDVARDIVTLDYQGRVLTLSLRTSKISSAPVAGPLPAAGQNGPNPPVVLNPSPADEVARFNRVKEEIARRRALREQNNIQGNPTRR
ncbi:MAG: hypothetical protein JWM32_2468 [Verrucomicrobia bacterium]|nr:hypothetical protein [Verrucomicrobiota bacterium]